jgi:hypothetical protein
VAARNELAKQLRREKRRDEATAVAALRRPGWDDWALNATAVEQVAEVAAFADAATAVQEAQAAAIEGRDGPDVRTALHDLRGATTVLVRLATAVLKRVGRQAGGGELAGRLAEVAGTGAAVEQLRAGVLGAGGDAPAELFAGLQPVERDDGDETPVDRGAGPATGGRRPARRPPADDTADDTSGDTADDQDGDTVDATDAPAPTRREVQAEREERRRRKEALQEATRTRREVAKAAGRADDAFDAAATALRRAERALAEAQQALATAEEERDEAVDALRAADEELARAGDAAEEASPPA